MMVIRGMCDIFYTLRGMNPVAFCAVALVADMLLTSLVFIFTLSPWSVIAPWASSSLIRFLAVPVRLAAIAAIILLITGALRTHRWVTALLIACAAVAPGPGMLIVAIWEIQGRK